MNMLAIHAAALETVNEAHHLFLLRYKAEAKIVYGIVEGKDDPMFYRSIIERELPDGWSVDLIKGGNKSKVLAIEAALDWQKFSRLRIVFFVDRDLSPFADHSSTAPEPVPHRSNIYVTDDYSIENSITTPETFRRMLTEVYNVSGATLAEEDNIQKHFAQNFEKFQECILPIMVQILDWRRNSVRAHLDKIKLAPMFTFQSGNLTVEPAFAEISARINHAASCVGASAMCTTMLDEKTASFCTTRGSLTLTRGKYALWCFSHLLEETYENISSFVAAHKEPPRKNIQIGFNNIMVVAAPRARPPQSLKLFIAATFGAYVQSQQTVAAPL